MKDASGEKAAGALKKMIGFLTISKLILRGELLKPIPVRDIQTRTQPNFYLDRDPNITLQAVEDDVAPLDIADYYLLCAIQSPYERFRVFSDPHWLEWGGGLKVGDEVYVRLPSPNTSVSMWSNAVVRCKCSVKTLPGTTFGVEITVRKVLYIVTP